MAKYIPTRSFLVRQEDTETEKKKDITAKRGVSIELTDKEAIKFWGSLKIDDKQKQRLLGIARANSYNRLV
jgi:hypothetical protein